MHTKANIILYRQASVLQTPDYAVRKSERIRFIPLDKIIHPTPAISTVQWAALLIDCRLQGLVARCSFVVAPGISIVRRCIFGVLFCWPFGGIRCWKLVKLQHCPLEISHDGASMAMRCRVADSSGEYVLSASKQVWCKGGWDLGARALHQLERSLLYKPLKFSVVSNGCY